MTPPPLSFISWAKRLTFIVFIEAIDEAFELVRRSLKSLIISNL